MSELRGQDSDPGTTDDVDLDALIGDDPEPDDDPGPDEDPDPGPEGDPQPPAGGDAGGDRQTRQPSRAERRIRALTQQIEDERRQRQTLEQQLTQLRTPPLPDPRAQAAAEQAELERVQMMAPHEVAQYYARRSEERVQQTLLRSQLETRDLMDRQSFAAVQRQEPIAKRLADKVEQTLAQARSQGMNPTREAILNLLVGQEIRDKARQQIESQRRRGARQIAAQTTQPGSPRSNVPSERGRHDDNSIAAIERRLENVIL
jgi:hypothetical protein